MCSVAQKLQDVLVCWPLSPARHLRDVGAENLFNLSESVYYLYQPDTFSLPAVMVKQDSRGEYWKCSMQCQPCKALPSQAPWAGLVVPSTHRDDFDIMYSTVPLSNWQELHYQALHSGEGFEVRFCLLVCLFRSVKPVKGWPERNVYSKPRSFTAKIYQMWGCRGEKNNSIEKRHALGDRPKLHTEEVVAAIGSFLWQLSDWKMMTPAVEIQCNLLFSGKCEGIEAQGCLLTHSWGAFHTIVDLVLSLWLPWHQRDKRLTILKLNSLTNKIVSIWGYVLPPTPSEPFQKNTSLKYGWNASHFSNWGWGWELGCDYIVLFFF